MLETIITVGATVLVTVVSSVFAIGKFVGNSTSTKVQEEERNSRQSLEIKNLFIESFDIDKRLSLLEGEVKKLTETTEKIHNIEREITKISTVLWGVDENNGIRGDIKELKTAISNFLKTKA